MDPKHTLSEDLRKFKDMIESSETTTQLEAPVNEAIQLNIVPKLLGFMTSEYDSVFQFESAWVITNICSGPSTGVRHVVSNGGIDMLRNLLSSTSEQVLEQVIWALGNIAGDKVSFRNACLEKGCLGIIAAKILEFPGNVGIKSNATWTMLNLVRQKPYPAKKYFFQGLPVIKKIIEDKTIDTESLINSLQFVAAVSDENLEDIIEMGFVPHVFEYLKDENLSIRLPALMTLGNIITGNEEQTNLFEVVLAYPDFIPTMFAFVSNPNHKLRKEALWALSNVAAGNHEQIELILSYNNSMQILITAVSQDIPKVALEAGWVLSNLGSGATYEQINKMMNEGYLQGLSFMLSSSKTKMITIALEAVFCILKVGEEQNPESNHYLKMFISAGIFKKINEIAKNPETADKTDKLRDYYPEYFDEQKDIRKSGNKDSKKKNTNQNEGSDEDEDGDRAKKDEDDEGEGDDDNNDEEEDEGEDDENNDEEDDEEEDGKDEKSENEEDEPGFNPKSKKAKQTYQRFKRED